MPKGGGRLIGAYSREMFKTIKLDRIISIATLIASVTAIVLVLKKPQPVARPQTPSTVAANAQSFSSKLEQLEQPRQQGQPPAEVRLNSDEINAALSQANAPAPVSAPPLAAEAPSRPSQAPVAGLSAPNSGDPNVFAGVTIG